jgi:hypothetical protein
MRVIGVILPLFLILIYIPTSFTNTSNSILDQIPLHQNVTFVSEGGSGYPNSKPSVKRTYRIDGGVPFSEVTDYYEIEITKLGWKMDKSHAMNIHVTSELDGPPENILILRVSK